MEPIKSNSLNKSCGEVISSNCMFKVYALVDPISNYIRYIGYTGYPLEKRLKEHLTIDCKYYKGNWVKSLLKQEKVPIIKLIEDNLDIEEAKRREIYYIGFWGRQDLKRGILTNLTDGGTGGLGTVKTEKSKKNLSDKRMGILHPLYGKTLSEETKKKISIATSGKNNGFYGKHHSEETIEKIKQGMKSSNKPRRKGWTMSDEQKQKISVAKKGKKHTPEHIQKAIDNRTKKPLSDEHKQKISKANKGKHSHLIGRVFSKEHRENLTKALYKRYAK